MVLLMTAMLAGMPAANAQSPQPKDSAAMVVSDTLVADSAMAQIDAELGMPDEAAESDGSLHKQLKQKFIEGSAGFMSLVALALVLGLARSACWLMWTVSWGRTMWKVLKTCAAIPVALWPQYVIRHYCISARK